MINSILTVERFDELIWLELTADSKHEEVRRFALHL